MSNSATEWSAAIFPTSPTPGNPSISDGAVTSTSSCTATFVMHSSTTTPVVKLRASGPPKRPSTHRTARRLLGASLLIGEAAEFVRFALVYV
jgi:hypothetical protein